ncbi:laminin domain protein, putative [Rhizoctonia solani AG-3 Rhs1AP]|uniref:Laminin domain protein, putative n=1 Tax=Rhizoctonia solani AG-3 Rhs1AP TaxID=1086054 RepID=A0A0A1UHM9_9AGAM|nr:laminin domain protein, putative [Rhizoctonia solani AG-3 Rhs1AP]
MANHPGWYPPGQVCYPPELPTYLKNVHDLKPIIGVPSNDELIRIHDVVHAANRASGVPGMHDSGLLMKLADHLFSAQMAQYRSRYSLVTFPSNATYTPPALPSLISANLEPISGSPSDEEIIKVQDAVQSYQCLRRYPSMFDAHVNMELSQHLFDIQMARHMRRAGESPPRTVSQVTKIFECPSQSEEQDTPIIEGRSPATNNAGTGMDATGVPRALQLGTGIDVQELMERSNQLAERCNQLIGRSNELAERGNKANALSHTLLERFNQVFERFTEYVEQTRQPAEQSNCLAERFNWLFERFNQLVEQSSQPAQKANELAERSNQLTDRANQFAEQSSKHTERMGDVLKNVNKVLVGIQHAIVRSGKSNTVYSVDCLVNEKGQTPLEGLGVSEILRLAITATMCALLV